MRTINSSIVTQLESGAIRPFGLLQIAPSGTDYYYTDCDVPVVVGSDIYTPRGMEVGNVGYSASTIVDSASIKLDNVDDTLTSEFVGGAPQGTDAIVSLILLSNIYEVVVEPVKCFEGVIDEWSLSEGNIDITVAHKLTRWNKKTLNRHQSSCRFRFKSTACGYSGGFSKCDGSYVQCTARSNTANFGGFVYLPELERKEIYWGQNWHAPVWNAWNGRWSY